MATELAINPRLAQFVVQAIGRSLSGFAVLQGVTIITGGKARWAGEGFATALLLPGAPPSWGIILAACGIAGIWGTFACWRTVVAFSMFISAGWCTFFSVTFIVTAFQNERVAFTGIWAYLMLAVVYILVGVTYRESHRLER